MLKRVIGYVGAGVVIALGILGVLLDTLKNLPPALQEPWMAPLIAAISFVLLALGWQDELTDGKGKIIDLFKKLMEGSIYWKLALSLLTLALQKIISTVGLPGGLITFAQVALIVLMILGVVSAHADFTQRRLLARYHRRFATGAAAAEARDFDVL